jgi:hypothetical protein
VAELEAARLLSPGASGAPGYESAAAYGSAVRARGGDYLIEPAFAGTFTVLPEEMSKAFAPARWRRSSWLGCCRSGRQRRAHPTLAERVPVRLSAAVERVEAGEKGVTVRIAGEKAAKFDGP